MRGNHHGAPGQRPHGSHYYGQNGSGRPSNRRPRNFGSSDSYSPASNAALSSFGNLSVRDRQSGSYAEGADTTAKKQLKVLPPELRTEPGLPRRAFLHIVVLFASDPRVMAYATGVAEMFRAAGVDVWLMTELSKGGNTDGSGSYQQGPRWIKPENLVSLITASKADSLIVIGDRNMKNETCQSGKLVEVPLSQSIENILKHWSQLTGLRYFKPINNAADLTEDILLSCLKELTGHCGHARDRLYRLELSARELDEWTRTALRAAGQNDRHRRRSSVDTSGVSADGSKLFISTADQLQVEKLTRSQNAAIKLDSEFLEARNIVSNFGSMDADDPRQTAATVCVDLGLGKGADLARFTNYNPPPPEVVSDNAAVRFGPIPERIRAALLNTIDKYLDKVNKLGETISAVANVVGGVSLWTAYRESLLQSRAGNGSAGIPLRNGSQAGSHSTSASHSSRAVSSTSTPEEQQLVSMGFELPKAKLALKKMDYNVEDALNLLLQGGISDDAVQDQVDDGGWSMTGAAGKLQRQKKKEKQEQERREKHELRQQKQRERQQQQLQQKNYAAPHANRPQAQPRNGENPNLRRPGKIHTKPALYTAIAAGNASTSASLHTSVKGQSDGVPAKKDSSVTTLPIAPPSTGSNPSELAAANTPYIPPAVGESSTKANDVSVPLFGASFASFSSSFAETEQTPAPPVGFDASGWDNSALFNTQGKAEIPSIGFESSPWVPSPSSKLFNEDKDRSSFLFGKGLLEENSVQNKELDAAASRAGADPWKPEDKPREHASSLDELVASARSSSLQPGAQEFIPSFQKQQTEGVSDFSANQWGVNEPNGFDPRHGGPPPQPGFAEFSQFPNGHATGAYNAAFNGFGDEFVPAAEGERDLRVAFQAGVVNAGKYRDQASDLYNKTEK